MELIEKLEKILEKEYGICSREELVDALNKQNGMDVGVFLFPLSEQGEDRLAAS